MFTEEMECAYINLLKSNEKNRKKKRFFLIILLLEDILKINPMNWLKNFILTL